MKPAKPFQFKEFTVHQDKTAMKIGTDAVLLGAWCAVSDFPDSILDVGAGTGVIALMLAQRTDAMTIDAVEIDGQAYEQTVENFERSDWGDRLFCYHSSFQDFATEMEEEEEQYDLIVSNPPFYTDTYTTEDEARNTARFAAALPFEALLAGVKEILSPSGKFAVVLPYKEQEQFVSLAQRYDLYLQRVCYVKGTPESEIKRSLLEFSKEAQEVQKEELVIETARHHYTPEYTAMTRDFYLRM